MVPRFPARPTTVGGTDPDNNVQTDNNGYLAGTNIQSLPITLTSGGEVNDGDANANNNPTVDFGLVGYNLGNRVWADVNNNGLIDPTESGIPNVTVRLLTSAGTPADSVLARPKRDGSFINSEQSTKSKPLPK